jgi:hypothetical protein
MRRGTAAALLLAVTTVLHSAVAQDAASALPPVVVYNDAATSDAADTSRKTTLASAVSDAAGPFGGATTLTARTVAISVSANTHVMMANTLGRLSQVRAPPVWTARCNDLPCAPLAVRQRALHMSQPLYGSVPPPASRAFVLNAAAPACSRSQSARQQLSGALSQPGRLLVVVATALSGPPDYSALLQSYLPGVSCSAVRRPAAAQRPAAAPGAWLGAAHAQACQAAAHLSRVGPLCCAGAAALARQRGVRLP